MPGVGGRDHDIGFLLFHSLVGACSWGMSEYWLVTLPVLRLAVTLC